MSSAVDAIIRYETQRLQALGYSVSVAAIHALPNDMQLGNDVIVGTVQSDSGEGLVTEGATISGEALREGAVVALRRRFMFSGGSIPSHVKLMNAVRLHPYVDETNYKESRDD